MDKFYSYIINEYEGVIVNTDCSRYDYNEGTQEATWEHENELMYLGYCDDDGIDVEYIEDNNTFKDNLGRVYEVEFDERRDLYLVKNIIFHGYHFY